MTPSAVTMKQNTDNLFTILSNIIIKYADVEDLAIDVLLVTIEIDQVNYNGEAKIHLYQLIVHMLKQIRQRLQKKKKEKKTKKKRKIYLY